MRRSGLYTQWSPCFTQRSHSGLFWLHLIFKDWQESHDVRSRAWEDMIGPEQQHRVIYNDAQSNFVETSGDTRSMVSKLRPSGLMTADKYVLGPNSGR